MRDAMEDVREEMWQGIRASINKEVAAQTAEKFGDVIRSSMRNLGIDTTGVVIRTAPLSKADVVMTYEIPDSFWNSERMDDMVDAMRMTMATMMRERARFYSGGYAIADLYDAAREHARNNPRGHYWKRDAGGQITMDNYIRTSQEGWARVVHQGPQCDACGYAYCPACTMHAEVECGKAFIEGTCTQCKKEIDYAHTTQDNAATTEGYNPETVDSGDKGGADNAQLTVLQTEPPRWGRIRINFDDTRNLT